MIDTVLVFLGLIIILVALFQARKLYGHLKDQASKRVWKFMIVLISFFAVGYVAILMFDLANRTADVSKLTSFIFFFGAVFVFLTTIVSSKLNAELRTHADNLEALVQERTQKLHEAEAILVNSSKLAALGEMAGGIAHEINNPLAIIKGTAAQIGSHIKKMPLETKVIEERAARIEKTADRIAKIVYGLRTFSRDGSSDPFTQVNICELVTDTLSLCGEKFKIEGIKFSVSAIDENLICEGRAVELSQVLLNILNNAKDAVAEMRDRWIRLSVLDKGKTIEIRIEDSGRGIAAEHIDKLFQPFFTTKDVGKGTGLGLSIALGIIQSHQGVISVNRSSANTCFVIELPKLQS